MITSLIGKGAWRQMTLRATVSAATRRAKRLGFGTHFGGGLKVDTSTTMVSHAGFTIHLSGVRRWKAACFVEGCRASTKPIDSD